MYKRYGSHRLFQLSCCQGKLDKNAQAYNWCYDIIIILCNNNKKDAIHVDQDVVWTLCADGLNYETQVQDVTEYIMHAMHQVISKKMGKNFGCSLRGLYNYIVHIRGFCVHCTAFFQMLVAFLRRFQIKCLLTHNLHT